MSAYLIGSSQLLATGGPLATVGATALVPIPAGDLIYVLTARNINYSLPVAPGVLEYGTAFDTNGNTYSSAPGYPVAGTPEPNTNVACLFDINRQVAVVSNPIGIGGEIKIAYNPHTFVPCLGALCIVIGIPGASAGALFPQAGINANNTNTNFGLPHSPLDGVQNTVLGISVWHNLLGTTHSPADDGFTFLVGQPGPALTGRVYELTTGPAPDPPVDFTYSAPVASAVVAEVFLKAAAQLFINGFPAYSMQSIACRRDFCMYPWFG